jgi:hypothetical protein
MKGKSAEFPINERGTTEFHVLTTVRLRHDSKTYYKHVNGLKI